MKTLRTKAIKALANFIAEVNIETRYAEQAQNRFNLYNIRDFIKPTTELNKEELAEQIVKNSQQR